MPILWEAWQTEDMAMSKPTTTQDIKNAIQVMEDEGLPLTANVEIWIGGKVYHIKSMGHFHVIPNMTIELVLQEAKGL